MHLLSELIFIALVAAATWLFTRNIGKIKRNIFLGRPETINDHKQQRWMNVLLLAIPVALSATCAFMLPVATPPNAIAYSSGYVTMGEMIKGGVWLNAIALVLISLATYFIAVPVFGLVL